MNYLVYLLLIDVYTYPLKLCKFSVLCDRGRVRQKSAFMIEPAEINQTVTRDQIKAKVKHSPPALTNSNRHRFIIEK